jgi:hypothetical protein
MSTIATPNPKTWLDGDPMPFDDLNTEIRDACRFLVSGAHCTALLTADQSIPSGTVTALVWGFINDDTDSIMTEPSSVFTFARDGVISLRVNVTFSHGNTGNSRQTWATVNGGTIGMVHDPPSAGGSNIISQNLALDFPVAAGDVLVVNVLQDNGSAVNVVAVNTQLCLGWVGNIGGWDNPDVAPPPPAPAPSGGGPAPAPPKPRTPVRHVATYPATWSRTYISGGAVRWDDSKYCYQGAYPGYGGNQRSLVGFNYSSLESVLSGASRVSIKLTFYVSHSYWNAGATICVGAHKYTSKPGTWADGSVFQNMQRIYCSPGKSHSITLNSTFIKYLTSGYYKGIAFGPAPSSALTYYAFMNGAGQSSKPTLIVTYYK